MRNSKKLFITENLVNSQLSKIHNTPEKKQDKFLSSYSRKKKRERSQNSKELAIINDYKKHQVPKLIPFKDYLESKGYKIFDDIPQKNYLHADIEYWTQTKFPWDEELKSKNLEVFGFTGFRMNQVLIFIIPPNKGFPTVYYRLWV